jgi:hypothetical protein
MALIFFPWKNPSFLFGDAAFWVVAVFTSLFGIPGAAVEREAAIAIGAAAGGIGAFLAAGIQQASYSLQPE